MRSYVGTAGPYRFRKWTFPCTSVLLICIAMSGVMDSAAGTADQNNIPTDIWPSFRGDPGNSGYRQVSIPGPGSHDPEIIWDFDSRSVITSSVTAVAQGIFFGTRAGIIYCLDPDTGEEKWNTSLASSISSTPTVDVEVDHLYVGDDSGLMHKIDISSGEILWSWNSTTDMDIKSSPVLFEEMVIFGSYDSVIYSLYRENGSLAWKNLGCGHYVHTTSPIHMGSAYFGSCDGTLNSINARNGSTKWSFSDSFIPSSPAVSEGRVFFGAYDSNMYCLDAENGELVWNTTLGGDIYSSPAVGPDTVAVGCNDGRIYLMEKMTGSVIWSRDMGAAPLESSPVLTKNSVVVTYEQGLAVLDAGNGSTVHSFEFGDCGESSPSLMSERIYYGDRLGYVRCIGFKQLSTNENGTDIDVDSPS
ncbi:MAG: PQQ-binding-like beta-propeller repeat protein [Thermoplasmatota archaeon]